MIALLLFGCVDGRAPVAVDVAFEPLVGPENVDIQTARLEIADLRLLAPAPVAWMPSWTGTAVAHPGHDFAGPVRGELLGEWELDLTEPGWLGEAQGFEGEVASAEAVVHRLVIEGEADGVPFAVDAEIGRVLEGVPAPFELGLDTDAVRVVFDLDAALAPVDWTDTSGDGQLDALDEGFINSIGFGMVSAAAWEVEE